MDLQKFTDTVIDGKTPRPAPSVEEPVERWRAFINQLIEEGRFAARPWSWVCADGEYFFKIRRWRGDDARRPSLDDPVGIARSAREDLLTRRLGEIEPAVDVPLRLIGSCIIKRRLAGPDLWELARRDGGSAEVQSALEQCFALVGRVHRRGSPRFVGEAPVRDYARDARLPAPAEVCSLLQRQPLTLLIEGFGEMRNFRRDSTDGSWRFFDPSSVHLGAAEDDVAHIIFSLLLLNWRRGVRCTVWPHLNLARLKDVYESVSDRRLNCKILSYMLQRRIATYKDTARHHRCQMGATIKSLALTYQYLYLLQMQAWIRRQGL